MVSLIAADLRTGKLNYAKRPVVRKASKTSAALRVSNKRGTLSGKPALAVCHFDPFDGMALPSEGQEARYVNVLDEGLGKRDPIEYQWVLNAPPKLSSTSIANSHHPPSRGHRKARDDWLWRRAFATQRPGRATPLEKIAVSTRGARSLGNPGLTPSVTGD